MYPELHSYEVIRMVMINNQNKYIRKIEITKLTGLKYKYVSEIIRMAYNLGWVERVKGSDLNPKALTGNIKAFQTAYKIIKIDSWRGLRGAHDLLRKQKKTLEKNNSISLNGERI